MNHQVPDELISAYFDGEVSPDERAVVERLLAENDEAQRELGETARLSALLHSFPRESAPVALSDNVRRETAQRPLPARTPARTPAPTTSSSRHVWLQVRAAVISCITTAAVYAIIVNMAGSSVHPGDRSVSRELTSNAPASPSASPPAHPGDAKDGLGSTVAAKESFVEGQPELDTDTASDSHREAAKSSMPVAVDASRAEDEHLAGKMDGMAKADREIRNSADTKRSTGGGTPGLRDAVPAKPGFGIAGSMRGGDMGGGAPVPVVQTVQTDSLQIENFSNPLSNKSFLENLQEGKIYTFVPQEADPDNNAAVVDLMVVDIDRATEQILVLLGKPEDRTLGESAKKSKRAGDDLVVVYVVAPPDRLAQTLNDVTRHPDIVRWSPQLPLHLAGGTEPTESPLKKIESAAEQPADKRSEKEMAEANKFVEALVNRSNSGQSAGSLMNSVPQLANSAPLQALPGVKDNSSFPLPGAAGNAPAGPTDPDRKNTADKQRGTAFTDRIDYKVVNVPQGNSLSQNSPTGRALGLRNAAGPNGNFPDVRPESQAVRRQVAAAPNAVSEKSQRNDAGNRAVRMLLVLHPTQADAGVPAPAAKPDR
jgi:anti-sigma factor RsiW